MATNGTSLLSNWRAALTIAPPTFPCPAMFHDFFLALLPPAHNFPGFSCKACPTRVRFSCVALRSVTMRQDIISIFADFFYFGCWKIVLLVAWFSPSVIVRYKICHEIPHYRNRVLTYRDLTQRDTWKTAPCGTALKLANSKAPDMHWQLCLSSA